MRPFACHIRQLRVPNLGHSHTRDSPTVPTSIIHSLLSEIECDVLLLHDCWHAAQTTELPVGKGVIETLAASGFDQSASETSNQSFTASLVQELAHAAHTADWLPVVELHRRLMNRLQAWMPTVSFADDTYSLVQIDPDTGQPICETRRRPTPIHNFVSQEPRTIVLSPLPPQDHRQPSQSRIALSAPATQPQAIPDGPGVLVTCRLRDQNVEAQKWIEWLANAPDGAKNIQISAIYPGLSVVLLLEIPLVVWDLLPPSPAISFVTYTSGQNHISEFRRALGLDTDEASETSEDDSEGVYHLNTEKWHQLSNKRRKNARSVALSGRGSSLWPKMYEDNKTALYTMEYEPHCLNLAEMQQDHTLTKTGKIIRAFVQDAGNPSMGYLCDEIEAFCSTTSFEALTDSQEAGSELVAMLDERSPPTFPNPGMTGIQFLTHGQLYDALSRTVCYSFTTASTLLTDIQQSLPQLIDQKPDQLSAKRRLM